MKKGDYLVNKSGRVYQIAGRWHRDLVLAPVEDDDEQVLIYTAAELDEVIGDGEFSKLYKTGFKVKPSTDKD